MRRMPSQIELYEQMSLLSSRMVAAARASDWDKLIALEQRIAALRHSLLTTPEDCNALVTDLARKRCLIQHILDDDAEVRRHTEPWMERLRQFLGNELPPRELHRIAAAGLGESAASG